MQINQAYLEAHGAQTPAALCWYPSYAAKQRKGTVCLRGRVAYFFRAVFDRVDRGFGKVCQND